jgi:2-dehydropantoate 2-reductase
MMIKDVAVIGLGAVGALYARKLDLGLGHEHVHAIAEGQRALALRQGITINGSLFKPDVKGYDEAHPDLIIIAAKNFSLPAIMDQGLGKLIGAKTSIISLLNGIESEELLSRAYGEEHVLMAYAVGLSSERKGLSIEFTSDGRIVFGERDNSITERVVEIKALLDRCLIKNEVPRDIIHQMWRKFALNTAYNTLSAICRSGYGAFSTSAYLKGLVEDVFSEVKAVGHAQGVELNEEDFADIRASIARLDPAGKTSMLQDMEAARATESPWFTLTVEKLGKHHGIPTPVCSLLYRVSMAASDGASFKA